MERPRQALDCVAKSSSIIVSNFYFYFTCELSISNFFLNSFFFIFAELLVLKAKNIFNVGKS